MMLEGGERHLVRGLPAALAASAAVLCRGGHCAGEDLADRAHRALLGGQPLRRLMRARPRTSRTSAIHCSEGARSYLLCVPCRPQATLSTCAPLLWSFSQRRRNVQIHAKFMTTTHRENAHSALQRARHTATVALSSLLLHNAV